VDMAAELLSVERGREVDYPRVRPPGPLFICTCEKFSLFPFPSYHSRSYVPSFLHQLSRSQLKSILIIHRSHARCRCRCLWKYMTARWCHYNLLGREPCRNVALRQLSSSGRDRNRETPCSPPRPSTYYGPHNVCSCYHWAGV